MQTTNPIPTKTTPNNEYFVRKNNKCGIISIIDMAGRKTGRRRDYFCLSCFHSLIHTFQVQPKEHETLVSKIGAFT